MSFVNLSKKGLGFKAGFSLVEVLTVVFMISVLAVISFQAIASTKARNRDLTRKEDLQRIARALELYFDANGTYVVAGSGYVSSGVPTGSGWFSFENASYSYNKSVARALYEAGYLPSIIVDPSGSTWYVAGVGTGYMIQAGADRYTLWANLENPGAKDIATQNNCFYNNYDNYSATYPEARRINYCISN